MRIHHDISAERLTVFPKSVTGSLEGHADPSYAYPEQQHPTCVRLRSIARPDRLGELLVTCQDQRCP
jgi:hypothetical protein